jgi:hypothetical protein
MVRLTLPVDDHRKIPSVQSEDRPDFLPLGEVAEASVGELRTEIAVLEEERP